MRPPLSFIASDLNSALKMLEDVTPLIRPSSNLVEAKKFVNEALNAVVKEIEQSEVSDYE